jgi:hypothetical protein
MDMPLSSRAAVLKRLAAAIHLADDRPAVKAWSDLSVTEQLIVEGADSVLASVLKGQMSAAVELDVLSGKFSDEAPVAPVVKSKAELREEAIAAAFAALPPIASPEEQAARLRERQAEHEAARINSYVSAYGQWGG